MSLTMDVAYGCAAALTAPLWATRMLRTGKWRTDWAARFGRCHAAAVDTRPTLIIHAVSLGEVNAIRLLVQQLEDQHHDRLRIVIASTTDTGYARARDLFADRHTVVRYPLDFTPAVRRFLNAVQPTVVALVELEIWPNFVAECHRRNVPVLVINGRLSARSHARYRLIRPLVRRSLARLAAVAVQNDAYARRFTDLGVPAERLHVLGTMKWDNADIADHDPAAANLARALGIQADRPLIVCGSTGPDEETLLLEQLTRLRPEGDTPPPQFLLAPRKPERFDAVAAGRNARFTHTLGPLIRRSEHPTPHAAAPPHATSLFLLDTLGELRAAYALADLAIVGRSFVPLGGSDMADPIALGKPTVTGPHMTNFRDMMDDLLQAGGIVQLDDPAELPATARRLIRTDAGRHLAANGRTVIQRNQGATTRHAKLLNQHLTDSVRSGK